MKYSNYQQRENGYSLKGHSKFLQFILSLYCKRITKKFKKLHKLPKDFEVSTSSEITFHLDFGGINGTINNEK